MARRTKRAAEPVDPSDDEVDIFSKQREQIPLDETYDDPVSSDSEVEVLGQDVSEDSEEESGDEGEGDATQFSDDDEILGRKKDEEEEEDDDELNQWGRSRGAYYGADDLEEVDEEAQKEIEEEAIKLQKRHLSELNMNDFIDEDLAEDWQEERQRKIKEEGEIILKGIRTYKEEISAEDLSKLDSSELEKLLKSKHPEFIPLTEELISLRKVLDGLSIQSENEVERVKFTALTAYLATIGSYLALFLSQKKLGILNLKEHPVMEELLRSREAWRQANELLLDAVPVEETAESLNGDSQAMIDDQSDEDSIMDQNVSEDSDDLSEELSDFEQKVSMKRKAEDSEPSDSEEEGEDEDEFDLKISMDDLKKKATKSGKARSKFTNTDFADPSELAEVDLEEKKAKKKSLRFYTSKIDQKSTKKEDKYTGDMDLPYKERLFERRQRLMEEARKRGQEQQDDFSNMDDDHSEEDGESREAGVYDNMDDDDFYNQYVSKKKAQKSERKEAHVKAVLAASAGNLEELNEKVGPDGKRAINYQIKKNKGLTPHRKKENKNPRVKKRKKYEEAKKKLKSVRAVYKQPTSAYVGEATGISKNLARGVKF